MRGIKAFARLRATTWGRTYGSLVVCVLTRRFRVLFMFCYRLIELIIIGFSVIVAVAA